MLVGEHSSRVACQSLESSQGFSTIFEKLLAVDIDSASKSERADLIKALWKRLNSSCGPLTILGLPSSLQSEILLFSDKIFPGIDRTSYLRATPRQVIRKLTEKTAAPDHKAMCGRLLSYYPFSRFGRDDWKEYFAKCAQPLPFAKTFLMKDEKSGGFTDAEITDLALRNPQLIECIPPARLGPNTAVALLISGRAESLWKTYDFNRLQKAHWRELLLHTNPQELPAACKPYIENKDGNGFTSDELLQFALKCHSLINSLDPNKVPFSVAYELYQTGRADILWANYPFAQLDKTEWKKILTNPNVKIPDMFADVVKSNRFKKEELCSLALKNERLLPFLVAADISADDVVDLLLKIDAKYLWDNYHFNRFGVDQWTRLILGLSSVIRPRAMSAFSTCKGITPSLAEKIIRKNTAYCPYIPVAVIPAGVVVEVLVQGKGHFLWDTYDFSRLSNDQWLTLLGGIGAEIPLVGQQFLRNQSFIPEAERVESNKLNAVLIKNGNLIKYVSEQLIDPEVAYFYLSKLALHELWDRYDFTRFSAAQIVQLLKKTVRQKDWPESLKKCFVEDGAPLRFEDVLDILTANAPVVVDLMSFAWISEVSEGEFNRFVTIAGESGAGMSALKRRMQSGAESWCDLPILNLKSILSVFPALREHIAWKKWPYRVIADLANVQPVFETEIPHPNIYFLWKHWMSLLFLVGLSVAAIGLLMVQHVQLAQEREEKERWSSIVSTISRYDRSNAYTELNQYLQSLSIQDLMIISKDLLVINAKAHLEEWNVQQSKNDVMLDELKSMIESGLTAEKTDRIKVLLRSLLENRADIGPRKMEYFLFRDTCEKFIKAQIRKTAVDALKKKLSTVKDDCDKTSTISRLEGFKNEVSPAREYEELAEDVAETIKKLDARIAKIRYDELMKNVAAISNKVEDAAALLKNVGAHKSLPKIKMNFDGLVSRDGFMEYKKACQARYETVRDAISLFDDLMRTVKVKDSAADNLNRKFAREFLTVDGGAECSNLVSYCDGQIAKAKKGIELTDAIVAYESIRKKVKDIEARDLKAWELVDKLNATRDYAEYLRIRQELIRDFSEFAQLRSFIGLNVISLEDANAAYTVSTGYFGLSKKSVRYHFVGVIRLMPGEPNKVHIAIDNSKITASADLYLLTKYSRSGYSSVTEKLFIQQSGRGKYYRVNNVSYDGCQGTPLFVKDEHYVGGGK